MAADRWEALVDDAVAEIASGHHAAAVVESSGADCWKRAQFMAIREYLVSDLDPKTGIELMLIDSAAQAHTMKTFWMERMIALDAIESSDGTTSQLQFPRVNAFQAIEQAAKMVERFDQMFMRALRQLQDLRRFMPTVVVQRADQVNVCQEQLNVTNGH